MKKYGILFGSRPLGHGPSPVLCRWENHRMLSSSRKDENGQKCMDYEGIRSRGGPEKT